MSDDNTVRAIWGEGSDFGRLFGTVMKELGCKHVDSGFVVLTEDDAFHVTHRAQEVRIPRAFIREFGVAEGIRQIAPSICSDVETRNA